MVSVRQAWNLGSQSFKGLTAGRGSQIILPGSLDTTKVGDGNNNSIVEACLNTLTNAAAEPTPGVDTDGTIDTDHRAARLLSRPSPFMRGSLLTRYTVVSMNVWEHSIWFKQRNGVGGVVGLLGIPPMWSWAGDGNSELATAEERQNHAAGVGPVITHFEYQPPWKNPVRLEVEDVVYLRQDVDAEDPKRGRSRLKSLLGEVLTDEEAALFAAALLSNMGIPGVILVPDSDAPGPSPTEAEGIAEEFFRKFSGPRRGRPLMLSHKVTPHVMGFQPRQMAFKEVRRIPEERISGALGVPAILAGLGAGLESATYSNARELREFFTEQTLIPLWKLLAEELTWQLGQPDFGVDYDYDLTTVRALQEDQDALWTRNLAALEAGAITVAEFREEVGLEPITGTEIFLRQPTVLELASSNGDAPVDELVGANGSSG